MTFDDILVRWTEAKTRTARRRLDAPCSTEHEYKGSQHGHPSSYAFVRFECEPADEFTLDVKAAWPDNLTTDYRHLLIDAMSAAIVDVLIAADAPHVGCALTCTEVSGTTLVAARPRSIARPMWRSRRCAIKKSGAC